MSLSHKSWHLPVEKCHQQRPDMRTVDIGIAHHHNLAISPLCGIFFLADPTANSSDDVPNLVITQNAVETCAFHIQNLTAQRKDCLKNSVTAPFGRSASGVSLDQEELTEILITSSTIH